MLYPNQKNQMIKIEGVIIVGFKFYIFECGDYI